MAHMPYSLNPYLPKVRAKTVNLVLCGWSVAKAARYVGVNRSTVHRWLKQVPQGCQRMNEIPTKSARPKTHPHSLNTAIKERIIEIRHEHGRCGQAIYAQLKRENVKVSLATVQRTLKRNGLLKERSPWKKYHLSGMRPKSINPGDLVQVDTIHIMKNEKQRIYLYTLLDVHSRWAYAQATAKSSAGLSAQFVKRAQNSFVTNFKCLQSDHGPEFSNYFTSKVGTRHRHSRVRKPNDNAHLERFNRTIQEELRPQILRYRDDLKRLNCEIRKYLRYYNYERLHMGLDFQTPMEVLQRS